MAAKKKAEKLLIPVNLDKDQEVGTTLISLQMTVVALAEALAKAQPSTARLFAQELRALEALVIERKYAGVRVQIAKCVAMVETRLSRNIQ